MNIDKVHLRHVMLYEFRKGINVAAAVKNIQDVYQDQAPAKRTVEKWFAKFRRGEFNLEDDEGDALSLVGLQGHNLF